MGEEKKRKFGTASIPMGVLEEVDKLIKELRYWPSRSAFVREACLEKIRTERQQLRNLKGDRAHFSAQSEEERSADDRSI